MPKKLISGPILARLAQSWILILFFFSWVLPLLDVRHCRNLSSYPISRKLMFQTQENHVQYQKKLMRQS